MNKGYIWGGVTKVMLSKSWDFLRKHSIYFELYHHDLFTTECKAAVMMKEEKGFTGTETKALFLKGKIWKNYSFVNSSRRNQPILKRLKQVVVKK